MKITVTLGEMLDSDYWEEFCEEYGWDPYCINEGADETTEERITLEEAQRWGFL